MKLSAIPAALALTLLVSPLARAETPAEKAARMQWFNDARFSMFIHWDVGSTPYKKDLLKPLAEACTKHGIRFRVDHSIMDWSHPDWGTKEPWRGNAANPSPDMDRFTVYLKGQLMTKGQSIHQEPDRQTCPAFLYL